MLKGSQGRFLGEKGSGARPGHSPEFPHAAHRRLNPRLPSSVIAGAVTSRVRSKFSTPSEHWLSGAYTRHERGRLETLGTSNQG